ncbi:MAG: ATP-binding protein [Gammaproteobacteria bacterium]|nr:ATP-binding protein [Gammaproteobacteria bacterium]
MADYIPQAQLTRLRRLLAPNKVVVLYGPRRVGKTTLVQRFVQEDDPQALVVSGEDLSAREFLASQSVTALRAMVGKHQTLIVDEAQHVPQIGLNLKLLADHVEGLRIVATGSSSFELAQQTGEPLTGRKVTLLLLPFAQLELKSREAAHETRAQLDARMIYGSYPEVVLASGAEDREVYLKELAGAYLFKDILALEGIRHPDKLLRLLQLLAFQIGRDSSISELGNQLSMGKNTVQRYLDLLEKTFVVFSRMGFSRNQRKEIVKSRRYYFYDNGIRNAVINNFNPLGLRDDVGALWENYIQVERLKYNLYTGRLAEGYFWRTYDQQEVDLVEEHGGALHGFEIKWSPKANARAPKAWTKSYPHSTFDVVSPANYLEYIVGPA